MKIYKISNEYVAGRTKAEELATEYYMKNNYKHFEIRRMPISIGAFNRKKDASEIFFPSLDFQKVCEFSLKIKKERNVPHIYIMIGEFRKNKGYWISQQYHSR